jgi:hypothetical protein
VSLEHSYNAISPNMASAPKKFRVWGHVDKADTAGALLGSFEYDSGHSRGKRPRQTFAVVAGQSQRPVRAVRLEVMSNHGSSDYTCIYAIGVHGH